MTTSAKRALILELFCSKIDLQMLKNEFVHRKCLSCSKNLSKYNSVTRYSGTVKNEDLGQLWPGGGCSCLVYLSLDLK